tara:strand:+ start:107 stop:385 length:279 start_codon:yes stop_codon:yes gene_type:complete
MKCGGSKMAKGGALKTVPSGSKYKGLSMLPTAVRNKMGYAKYGKSVYDDGGMVGMPMYSNNMRIAQGRVLEYGGSCGPKVMSAKSLRRGKSF